MIWINEPVRSALGSTQPPAAAICIASPVIGGLVEQGKLKDVVPYCKLLGWVQSVASLTSEAPDHAPYLSIEGAIIHDERPQTQ